MPVIVTTDPVTRKVTVTVSRQRGPSGAGGGGGSATWGSITGTLSSQTDLQSALDAKLASSTAATTYQPLDSDLTAIAALSTTSFGRAFLALADAGASRTYLGLGTLATQSGTFSGTSSGTNTGDQDLSNLVAKSGSNTLIGSYLFDTASTITISGGIDFTDTAVLGMTAAAKADWRSTLDLVPNEDIQAYDADLASWAGVTRASGFDTFTATPSSANLAALLTDETGSGSAVFSTSPTLTTPALVNQGTGAFTATITHNGTLTANRTLTISVGNGDRTLTISGSATLNQDVSTGGNPTFANLALTGRLTGTTQALSGAGAVNVTTLSTAYTSTGGAQALTLADGTNGQLKTIVHVSDGGSGVLTPTTKTGYTTITFTNAGDSVTLQFFTTAGWCIVGIFGAVAA